MPSCRRPPRDEVGGAGILGHVERVLVAHVDDGGADLDALGARAHRREQREGRAELAREVVDAEIGAIGPDFFRRHGEIDRLQQRIGRGARAGMRRGRPMAEGEKADVFHHGEASMISACLGDEWV